MNYERISPDDILIKMQETPNPYALRFICNLPFKTRGKASFSSIEEARDLKLVIGLFEISGVKQIHLFRNFLTLTHSGDLSLEEFFKCVESVLKTRFPLHDPEFDFEDEKIKKIRKQHESEDLNKIEEILDRTIRPGLQADGGDLEVIELKDNELKIFYQGACEGCPSAAMGTLEAIENILRHELENNTLKVRPV